MIAKIQIISYRYSLQIKDTDFQNPFFEFKIRAWNSCLLINEHFLSKQNAPNYDESVKYEYQVRLCYLRNNLDTFLNNFVNYSEEQKFLKSDCQLKK